MPDSSADPYDLARFVAAQETTFGSALAELRAGHKRGHWIWFVFPQLTGLGLSHVATFYGLTGVDEAAAFAAHPVLGPRLHAALAALLACGAPPEAVLGDLDARKLRSCLTLFACAVPDDPRYDEALGRFFGGVPDPLTLGLLGNG